MKYPAREIKFRAWDKKNKKWTMPLISQCGKFILIEPFNYQKDAIGELIDIDVMQFTGLKDKNGKEIYEGDILVPPNEKMKHVVRFGEYDNNENYEDYDGGNGWFFEVFEIERPKKRDIFNMKDWLDNMKIIGNIYENPELWEEIK